MQIKESVMTTWTMTTMTGATIKRPLQ